MRQHIDADAEGLDLGGRFVNAAGNAGRVQREGSGQAADAAAEDDNVHGFSQGAQATVSITEEAECDGGDSPEL